MIQPPKVDERTAREIARDVYALLPDYVEGWPDDRQEAGELADALIHVFGRFGELIIDRLNKAPEKNFLAFLDLLGVSPLPLQAARAPVTFYLAQGAVSHALVPAGTQVAAQPGKGEQKPVVFETEKDLVVVSVNLESLILKDGGRDQCTDFNAVLTSVCLLTGATPDAEVMPSTGRVIFIPHILYIPLPVYKVWPDLTQIRLKVTLDADLPTPIDPRVLRWEACIAESAKATAAGSQKPDSAPALGDDGIKTIMLEPLRDGTENLTKSGDVVFLNIPEIPFVSLDDLSAHWLRCRLISPISYSQESTVGMVRRTQLPVIKSLSIETRMKRADLPLDQALFNNVKLDLTKDFFPFGNKPKFGDTLYLASREIFSNPDAVVTFHVTVTNPASSGLETPVPAARPRGTKLSWEFWDGASWAELGTAEVGGKIRVRLDAPTVPDMQFSDGTQFFSESGDITLKFPRVPEQLNLNGQKNYWIRVRIVGGDYGEEAHYEEVKGGFIEKELSKGGYVLTPATFAPPSIRSIKVDYAVTKESQPDTMLLYNDFAYTRINPQTAQSFEPFVSVPPDQVQPALYFGFALPVTTPKTTVFPNRALSMYAGMAASIAGRSVDPSLDFVVAIWEYWSGVGWVKCTVLDDTQGLRRPGLIRLIAPSDFASSQQFGQTRYWLRMRQNDPQFQPKFTQVLLNTTMAIQGSTIANEILGASNETPSQQFRTTQAPVLTGQKLEVREPTEPSKWEREQIEAHEGENAIVRVSEPNGKSDAFWVSWFEVPNFYGSGPRDRHYLLDRMSGVITLGDGTNGMIPPGLPGNLRLSYRMGGGTAGNKPACSITQLRSAIPYVQKASNCEAASGGTDPETDSELLVRGPRGIRHGGRAVTSEDFEDLAKMASHEVARAKCVPLFDLTQDPDARRRRPGMISLIIVPRSTDIRPRPGMDLFDRVRSYLNNSRQLTADLTLVGPEYVRVDVDCEIAVSDPGVAAEVEPAAKEALDRYLHPVTGGPRGKGWDFGREPKRSDFFGLLEDIPGVSHIRELRVSLIPDRPGSEKTGRFLICAGNHKVTTTLEE